MNIFKKIFGGAKKAVVEFVFKFYNDNKGKAFETVKNIALSVVREVKNFDLSSVEGRHQAADFVLALAKTAGLDWGKKILEAGEDEARNKMVNGFDHDLKRYIHLALLSRPILEQMIAGIIPSNLKFLNMAIEWALNELDEVTAE